MEKNNHDTERLHDAAFEALLLYPGQDFNGWLDKLISLFGIEVVDALGTDPATIAGRIKEMWNEPYRDPASRLTRTFSQWAEAFATEELTRQYYEYVKSIN